MAVSRLHQGKSTSLVTSSLLVNGEELSDIYQVMNITVTKELNRIASAQIILLDGNAALQDFELSNLELLIPGNKIEIWAGYHSDEEIIFRGIIIKHSLKIRSNQSYLIIECRDEAVKLTVGRKNNCFYDSTDSEVFEEIIEKYGLERDIESTTTEHRELIQYHVTDWDFMMTRVQANGKICITDDGLIAIRNPDFEQDVLGSVSYGDNLLDMDASIDARSQFKKITSYGWDAAEQELMATTADSLQMNLNGNLTTDQLADTIGLDRLELRNGSGNAQTLQIWANAKALFQQLAKVRGRIKVQGHAQIKPDTIILLEGVGDRFSGKIYVSGIRHEITEGNWVSDVQFGLDPVWFVETYATNDLPAAGLYPVVNGLQIGIVTQLEDDPENENRVLVSIPMIDKSSKGIWARVSTLDAGENRGSFFLPEIGDEVILGFINDNPQDAVILGMLNSSAKPAPIDASDENHEKGFVTRSGIKLLFNDDEKSIAIETPGGKKVILDEDAGMIQLEDEHGNSMILDSNGISFDTSNEIIMKAAGDINIEGMHVNIKADGQFKAEGSAGAEMSTSAVAVVKGSIVQIN